MKKQLIKLRNLLRVSNRIKTRNRGRISGFANMLNAKITINGDSEVLLCGSGIRLRDISVHVRGAGNRLVINEGAIVSGCIELLGDGNLVEIGSFTKISGAFIAAHNGTKVVIGGGCLFSTEIDIRTTDSHKIFDSDGVRINPDKNIDIADHVWIGRHVSVLKGSRIGAGSVVGAGSLVSGIIERNCIYAGMPARKIRENIRWKE